MNSEEQVAAIREAVSHIARGCRAGTSHNPAVYENEIATALDALLATVDRQREALAEALYEAAVLRDGGTPAWDQQMDGTKALWLERAALRDGKEQHE